MTQRHRITAAEYEEIRAEAERECPPDLIEFGARHKIEAFAVHTWQNGYRRGYEAALKRARREKPDAP